MRGFRDFPIKSKMMSISLLASSAALVLACAGFVTYELLAHREATLNKLASVAGVIAVNSGAALRFDDSEGARLTLSGLRAETQIMSACIYNADGVPFAEYLRDAGANPCPIKDPRHSHDLAARDDLTFAIPIVDDADELGSIWIQADSVAVFARARRYGIIIGLVLLASAGLASLLASRLQRFISAPILRLVESAREVSTAKDFSVRVAKGGEDEIGLLITSFNEMLAQIQERDRRLSLNREHLEEAVEERTAGLVSAVEELHAEIDQRKKAEERIRFLAYYDVLTGLPNRQYLREHLVRALDESAKQKSQLALLFLDLDRFKEINDSFGHSAGDVLLRRVADRLLSCVRRTDWIAHQDDMKLEDTHTVSRQGGDEFTILLTRVKRSLDASRVAGRILEALQEPIPIGDREVVVGASIGIAVYPTDGGDADTLLKHADTAMYHAKSSGRNDFQYFSASMKEAALQKVTMENDLRKAIERKEFVLHYQPKHDVRTGEVSGVEALLRWNHPVDGMVPPADFIAVAEESGLIVPIGAWVLRAACQQCKEWRESGIENLRMAVNVSNLQFMKTSFLSTVMSILQETTLDPHLLELEITETTMMQDEVGTVRTLDQLKELGVRVALDDFGTGFSSLSYVHRLPLHTIKIDRSFISELGSDVESASIVTAIIAMAHSLGLQVVAEGVETQEQADFLRGQDCDEVQGYLFSKPLPPAQLEAYFSAKSWLR